jgi:hypothetical protein
VLYLASVSTPDTDDPPDFAAINECHEVQDSCLRSERDHARLAVVGPVIDPYQRIIERRIGLVMPENAKKLLESPP